MSNITKYLLTLTFITLIACNAWADTHTAASCTKAAVLAAYNAASNGDIIVVPTGDCSSSNTWTSVLEIKKEVTIQGKGIDSTYIGLGFTGPAFEIEADNVRITGFTFDCRNQNTSNTGIIMAGSDNGACNASAAYTYGDFRIDHNKFVRCDEGSEGTTGYNAITSWQTVYGLIDNNTFENCTGECLSLQSDGVGGISRSNEPGQYADNVTIYVEDNTWNYSQSWQAENVVDGNSSSRFVFRYNTINLTGSATIHQVFSNHETCASSACDAGTKGDAGSALMEIYNNTINNNSADPYMYIVAWRSGRLYAYNNTITGADTDREFVQAYSLRSGHRSGCAAQTVRGYGEYCHEDDGSGLVSEGLSKNKTTLNGALGNDTGCPIVANTMDFPTYGGSIIVGAEQIDYKGISGNQLTPCTRGANGTTRAAHSNGVAVNLLKFGVCLEQQNHGYIWGNKTVGNADKNTVFLDPVDAPDYTSYDIQSYTQRPGNWQYRNDGTAYNYTPYTYPHPLRAETPSQTTYVLTVVSVNGTLTSTPSGINCGSTCFANYDSGTSVTLTASPNSGYIFTGWSGGGCSGTGTCTVPMTAATSVTANYATSVYNLAVTKSGTGAGTVTGSDGLINCGSTCSVNYESGKLVTLTASANSTSTFSGWSGACSGTGTCTVTMTTAKSVTATFIPLYNLTVTKSVTAAGVVTSSDGLINCGSTCSVNYDPGTSVTLTVSANSGYTFTGWSGGGCSGTSNCTVTMTTATSVTASFATTTYNLTVTKSGTGSGTVTGSDGLISCGSTCSVNYESGKAITLATAANSGSTFSGWSGGCSGTGTCTVTMTAAKSITAAFNTSTSTAYNLTVTKSGTGSGTVTSSPSGINCGSACSANYSSGTLLTVTTSASSGSTFSGWSGACSGKGTCTVPMTAAKSVKANFAKRWWWQH